MRPYRGKRIDNGEWVYGWYYEHLPSKKSFIKYYEDFGNTGIMRNDQVDRATVGQSIGIRDKNGREICFGDILQGIKWSPSIVVWNESGLRIELELIKTKDKYPLAWMHINEHEKRMINFEIVGTIHDKGNKK